MEFSGTVLYSKIVVLFYWNYLLYSEILYFLDWVPHSNEFLFFIIINKLDDCFTTMYFTSLLSSVQQYSAMFSTAILLQQCIQCGLVFEQINKKNAFLHFWTTYKAMYRQYSFMSSFLFKKSKKLWSLRVQ